MSFYLHISGLNDKVSGQWFMTNESVISVDALYGVAKAIGPSRAWDYASDCVEIILVLLLQTRVATRLTFFFTMFAIGAAARPGPDFVIYAAPCPTNADLIVQKLRRYGWTLILLILLISWLCRKCNKRVEEEEEEEEATGHDSVRIPVEFHLKGDMLVKERVEELKPLEPEPKIELPKPPNCGQILDFVDAAIGGVGF
ncbi:hypothetical protein A2U01_0034644 [Trifolium medium]|uniref:Uncharacterized protein n=1 Tax=Trifolium medium TaxID=97028 RepID=A0A392PQE7_9FABA|nr:hypothetical protein [Trifolium medium]